VAIELHHGKVEAAAATLRYQAQPGWARAAFWIDQFDLGAKAFSLFGQLDEMLVTSLCQPPGTAQPQPMHPLVRAHPEIAIIGDIRQTVIRDTGQWQADTDPGGFLC